MDTVPSIRLYDRIVSRNVPLAPLGASFVASENWRSIEAGTRAKLAAIEGQRIVADKIDEFVTATFLDSATGNLLFDSHQMPNLIPPFETFWVEWAISDPFMRQRGLTMAGSLVQSVSSSELQLFGFELRFFLYAERAAYVFRMAHIALVSSTMTDGAMSKLAIVTDPEITGLQADVSLENSMVAAILPSALLTVSFMNCGNAQVSWVRPPEQLAKAFSRRNKGYKPSPFRTIDIVPVTRLMAEKRQAGEGTRSTVFHTIRGHFKRYADKGLFGKHKGTFFFPSHQAGSKSENQRPGGYRIKL